MSYQLEITYDWARRHDGVGLLRFDATAEWVAGGPWLAAFPIDHEGARAVLEDTGDLRRWGINLIEDATATSALAGWVRAVEANDGASGQQPNTIILSGLLDAAILGSAPAYAVTTADTSTTATTTMAAYADVLSGNAESELLRVIAANVGLSAPARRRLPMLTIPVSAGRGGTVSISRRFPSLLALAREVCESAGLTVSVARVESPTSGLALVVGEPVVRDEVRYSREGGTLLGSTFVRRAADATSVLPLGKGEGVDRLIGPRVEAPPPPGGWAWPHEQTLDATSEEDPAKLAEAAAKRLDELAPAVAVALEPSPSPGWLLGADFEVGDFALYDVIGGTEGSAGRIDSCRVHVSGETAGQWRTVPAVGQPLDDVVTVIGDVISAVTRRGRQ